MKWMSRIALCACVAWAVPAASRAADQAAETDEPPAAAETDESPVAVETKAPPDLWFPVGEEIVYRVHWGRIRVGTSRIRTDWVEEDGRTVLRIRLRTRSNRFLSAIYPVDSLIESVIDPHTFRPLRFVNQIREGRRFHDEVTVFDWEEMQAHWVSHVKDETKSFEIREDTRCIPALLYYLRRTPLKPGRTYTYEVMADEKLFDVMVKTEEYERVRLPRYGRVRSLRMEPQAAFDGVFVRAGRMWMWVSDDDRRVATRISAEVPIARVHLTIDRVRGPGNDAWVSGSGDDDGEDDEDGEE